MCGANPMNRYPGAGCVAARSSSMRDASFVRPSRAAIMMPAIQQGAAIGRCYNYRNNKSYIYVRIVMLDNMENIWPRSRKRKL